MCSSVCSLSMFPLIYVSVIVIIPQIFYILSDFYLLI